jgi:amino acid transporter
MAAFMAKTPIFIVLIGVCFILSDLICTIGVGFAPTRNIFAWSFDRLIPPQFSRMHPRLRAPMWTITATFLVAWFFFAADVFQPVWTADVGFTIFGWFVGWIILGVAAIVFPYSRRDLFEASPPIVKTRVFGVPLITVLGVLTLIVSLFIEWQIFVPVLAGTLPMTQVWITLVLMAIPVVIYAASTAYYNRQGVPLSLQFQQVPPE